MKIGKGDNFETNYMNKFRALASPFGLFLEHEKDRAALDIGMHLTQTKSDGSKVVTPAVVWFQLKGVMASTRNKASFAKEREIKVPIDVPHLRFWYLFPHPVFLVVYVEALDEFVVLDVKHWVTNKAGGKILTDKRKRITVPVPLNRILDESAFYNFCAAAQVPHVAKMLESTDRDARVFIRDDQLLKWIGTAEKRGMEMKMTVVKYGSKTRTEVYFEERQLGDEQWAMLRSHWEYMMPCPTKSFPYLDFEPFDEESFVATRDENGVAERADTVLWYDDSPLDFDELFEFDDGRIFSGKGQFERMEFEFRPKLNAVGIQWAGVLDVLENAEVLAVNEQPAFVSII